jgi:hypothetical protein
VRALPAVMALTVATHALSAQRLARPTIDTLDHHIVRVMNHGPTEWADTNGWKLVYERTVQPADGSPGELGDIGNVALLSDGTLVEAETKHASLKLFDAHGALVRTIGRDGDGPGEYRSPYVMSIHDTIVIQDPQTHRATWYARDGRVIRSYESVCCSFGVRHWIDDRGELTVAGLGDAMNDRWLRIDRTGGRLDSLTPPSAIAQKYWLMRFPTGQVSGRSSIPYSPENRRIVLHDGRILYGATDTYRLIISGNGRDTTRIFGRTDVPGIALSSSFRDSLFHGATDRNPRLQAVAKASDIPEVAPLWNEVMQDGAGSIWVARHARTLSSTELDVFAVEGRYLGAVAFAGGANWAMSSWSRDHVAIPGIDGNDLPEIRIYRVDRRRSERGRR